MTNDSEEPLAEQILEVLKELEQFLGETFREIEARIDNIELRVTKLESRKRRR